MCYPALYLMPPSKTGTPVLAFTPDLIYMLGNVSSLVNVKWYLGEWPPEIGSCDSLRIP